MVSEKVLEVELVSVVVTVLVIELLVELVVSDFVPLVVVVAVDVCVTVELAVLLVKVHDCDVVVMTDVEVVEVAGSVVSRPGGNFTQMMSQNAGASQDVTDPPGLNTSEMVSKSSIVKQPSGSNDSFLRCKHSLKPLESHIPCTSTVSSAPSMHSSSFNTGWEPRGQGILPFLKYILCPMKSEVSKPGLPSGSSSCLLEAPGHLCSSTGCSSAKGSASSWSRSAIS